ncbi:MAG TPA: EsaB/YukD family protein [Ktedonobacteraceae bacterium]|nr:EsaB/YukD family protein [Ktedonobacteraceae bacterium]
MSEKLLITIQSLQRTVDVQLPDDVRIGDLLPYLAEACGFFEQPRHSSRAEKAVWSLSAVGASQPFAAERTLADCGVMDGDTLQFQERISQVKPVAPVHEPAPDFADILPSEETGWLGVTWRELESM